ncbi:hypothetical protein R3P38DRAFT_1957764 [Favolaschia claudopus]|uniref:Uncharacterized protein n=1 Tax=Favolaschia claudopus TaxID=2862362 RepID=A0AAW0A193_9AGAR
MAAASRGSAMKTGAIWMLDGCWRVGEARRVFLGCDPGIQSLFFLEFLSFLEGADWYDRLSSHSCKSALRPVLVATRSGRWVAPPTLPHVLSRYTLASIQHYSFGVTSTYPEASSVALSFPLFPHPIWHSPRLPGPPASTYAKPFAPFVSGVMNIVWDRLWKESPDNLKRHPKRLHIRGASDDTLPPIPQACDKRRGVCMVG